MMVWDGAARKLAGRGGSPLERGVSQRPEGRKRLAPANATTERDVSSRAPDAQHEVHSCGGSMLPEARRASRTKDKQPARVAGSRETPGSPDALFRGCQTCPEHGLTRARPSPQGRGELRECAVPNKRWLTFELWRPARRGALGPRRTMEPATALRGPRAARLVGSPLERGVRRRCTRRLPAADRTVTPSCGPARTSRSAREAVRPRAFEPPRARALGTVSLVGVAERDTAGLLRRPDRLTNGLRFRGTPARRSGTV